MQTVAHAGGAASASQYRQSKIKVVVGHVLRWQMANSMCVQAVHSCYIHRKRRRQRIVVRTLVVLEIHAKYTSNFAHWGCAMP